ncbi:MAG: hypothetical protein KBG28_22315 [Kofleriaceae bacterium]|nr:hypothetical protein [Kofleriaceae bacterium]MBP9206724.1 hypothetical protein [Kofleriaceae bacterium]
MNDHASGTSQHRDATPAVAELAGARQPADHGLSALGLIMQLAGSVFGAIVTGTLVVSLLTIMMMSSMRGGGGGQDSVVLWILLLAAASGVRSWYHRGAGTQLLYGTDAPLSGIRRYVAVAFAQTALILLFLLIKADAGGKVLLTMGAMLGAWPAALAILLVTPRIKALGERPLPVPEDKGFEGVSILMTILGLTGLGFALIMLYGIFKLPGELMSKTPVVLMMLTFIALAVRSGLHVRAGWTGLSQVDMNASVEAAGRYADFGVITAFVGGGAMLVIFLDMPGGITGSAFFMILAYVSMIAYLLAAWPMIIRRYFGERQFSDLMAGVEAPVHRRAPDMGLTALGWLLTAFAVMTLGMTVPGALFSDGSGAASFGRMGGGLDGLMAMSATIPGHSPWWGVGVAGLQLWAGLELIRMSDLHKPIATAYGVVATVVALWLNWPALKSMSGSLGILKEGPLGSMLYMSIAVGLIIPIGTAILVNRHGMAGAQARYRK